MAELSAFEVDRAKKSFKKLREKVTIIVKGGDSRAEKLADFAYSISALSEGLIEVREEGRDESPALLLGRGDIFNIRYLAVPLKKEFEPFIESILALSSGLTDLKKETKKVLRRIRKAVELKVFVTPLCPHCAKVVKTANSFAAEVSNISVVIIDATLFPELQRKYRVLSTPTVLINDRTRIIGEINEDELLGWLVKEGTVSGYYASLLIQGRAEEILNMARENPDISFVMAELLVDPDMGVRIGAAVVLQEIQKKDARIVSEAIRRVSGKVASLDDRIKGDFAFILGELGNEAAREYLLGLANDENREVRETAIEALEKINKFQRVL
jgi:thiol-disulfide isomerase/thioredoxin